MPKPKDYDTTVARIAGNLLSGKESQSRHVLSWEGSDGEPILHFPLIRAAVATARAIVAETRRTEPEGTA